MNLKPFTEFPTFFCFEPFIWVMQASNLITFPWISSIYLAVLNLLFDIWRILIECQTFHWISYVFCCFEPFILVCRILIESQIFHWFFYIFLGIWIFIVGFELNFKQGKRKSPFKQWQSQEGIWTLQPGTIDMYIILYMDKTYLQWCCYSWVRYSWYPLLVSQPRQSLQKR